MRFSNTTSSADPRPGPRALSSVGAAGAAALALTLVAVTVPHASATRMLTWPWCAPASAFWAAVLGVALFRLLRGAPDSRLGGALDVAFASLAAAGSAAALASPLRATLAPHLLPFLGALALPYALAPLVRSRAADALGSLVVWPVLVASLWRWGADGGWSAGPWPRNAHPFGHANAAGSFAVVALGWLAWRAFFAQTVFWRAAHATAAAAALLVAVTSSNRGSILAIAAGATVFAALTLLRRGRWKLFLAVALLLVAGLVAANPRLRELALRGAWSGDASESNAQRRAMIVGGLRLAAERPLAGWGPGAIPHVFPRVRSDLPGAPDNYLQLHNTPAQTAATLGLAGLLASGLLAAALGLRLRARLLAHDAGPADRALAATAAATLATLLFDHPFALPAFAALAAAPVAALAIPGAPAPRRAVRLSLAVAGLALVGWTGFATTRDTAARAAWSSALERGSADDPSAYLSALRRAADRAPADPFYRDLLASHFATGHPFGNQPIDKDRAIAELRAALAINPDHEAARYNLGWLLHSSDPAEAVVHFEASAKLAPARAGVHVGRALAALALGDETRASRSLAAEILLSPAFAWSPVWRDGRLAPLRKPALDRAAEFLRARDLAPELAAILLAPGEPQESSAPRRRVRTGHGVLYGHPDGPPPTDVPVFFPPDGPLPPAAVFAPDQRPTPIAALLECAGLAEGEHSSR